MSIDGKLGTRLRHMKLVWIVAAFVIASGCDDTPTAPTDTTTKDASDTQQDMTADVTAPDAQPDQGEDTNVPDTNIPDTNIPDTNVPDTNVPDTSVPDTNVPDTNGPDTNIPDTNIPDANVPDTNVPDATVPDTNVPDTNVPDMGTDQSDGETSTPSGDFEDDFAGNGPLLDYTTNNPDSLPEIARVDGRYRANLTNNASNITLHFNQSQGRLDAKLLTFPFDIIARNIGIGTQADSQTAPPSTNNPFLFAGVQVHTTDLDSLNSSHVVVGHRGGTQFTVEGKNTVNGSSNVNDDGENIVPDGRADIRIVGNADHTLTVYWQVPNLDPANQADNWETYKNSGSLPGSNPAYGDQVYVGLITYAYGQTGVPFVGTCDSLEGGSL